jgi:hypothetical protein
MIHGYLPEVATALKRPEAMRSISSSMSCSDEDGEFRIVYEVLTSGITGAAGVDVEGFGAAGMGGRSEKRAGEGEMKPRY